MWAAEHAAGPHTSICSLGFFASALATRRDVLRACTLTRDSWVGRTNARGLGTVAMGAMLGTWCCSQVCLSGGGLRLGGCTVYVRQGHKLVKIGIMNGKPVLCMS